MVGAQHIIQQVLLHVPRPLRWRGWRWRWGRWCQGWGGESGTCTTSGTQHRCTTTTWQSTMVVVPAPATTQHSNKLELDIVKLSFKLRFRVPTLICQNVHKGNNHELVNLQSVVDNNVYISPVGSLDPSNNWRACIETRYQLVMINRASCSGHGITNAGVAATSWQQWG